MPVPNPHAERAADLLGDRGFSTRIWYPRGNFREQGKFARIYLYLRDTGQACGYLSFTDLGIPMISGDAQNYRSILHEVINQTKADLAKT